MQGLLGATLILLAACSLAAMATAAFRVPALLGYLSVGVVLGPSVIGVIAPGETLSFLSELGVALLLFMVGLEFSLGHFWLARRTVLMAGALQMIAVAPPLILLLMWLGQPGQSAVLLGTAAAMSSTALVSRQLADQGELTTRHGRSAIAVLVFQDLASVPLLALLAIWARGESPKIEHVLLEVFGVLLLFAAAALASRRLLHGLLGWVARRGHEESFVLVSLCVVVAAAAAAHAVGVSAALGALLAGMVLGESDFRHHMESHLRPFRDVLSGLFFVTIGLQLDVAQIVAAPLAVLGWLLALVPLKMGLNFLALRATRLSALDAWRTGIVLGHGGEFALLLSRTLRLAGVPHLLLESDRQRVEAGRAMGAPVSYGDASRLDTLAAAGLAHARLVVLTLVRPQTAERIARAVLERRPTLPLVVATDRVTDAQLLRNLPNVRLYPLYLALGLGLAEQVLLMLGINADYVNRRIEELRQTLSESGGDRP